MSPRLWSFPRSLSRSPRVTLASTTFAVTLIACGLLSMQYSRPADGGLISMGGILDAESNEVWNVRETREKGIPPWQEYHILSRDGQTTPTTTMSGRTRWFRGALNLSWCLLVSTLATCAVLRLAVAPRRSTSDGCQG